MYGWQFRECQQIFLICGVMAIMALWLKNIWIIGFVLWSIFSYISHGFQMGQVYLSNIFFGSVLYFFSLGCFKKEDIYKYLNVFIWFVVLNLWYIVPQTLGYDPIYQMTMWTQNGFEGFQESNDPVGFMAFRSAMGMLMAMAIPVVMTRTWKLAKLCGFLLIIPIFVSSASIAIIASGFAILFVLWHSKFGKMRKFKTLIITLLALAFLVGGCLYATKRDDALRSFGERADQWKLVMRDAMIHPIAGWGMDSFRNITEEKKWHYAKCLNQIQGKDNQFATDIWDNPHNMLVSLFFEGGIIWVIMFLGYFIDITRRFLRSYRMPNTVALYGVMIVAFVLSLSHFPLFLARFMCFLIPMAAMLEIELEGR